MFPFFRLKVQKVEQICLFSLSWGQGQEIQATLSYPDILMDLYQEWQRTYLTFYKGMASLSQAQETSREAHREAAGQEDALRSRVKGAGSLSPATDWRTKLVEAETRFLNEFHYWLRGAELFEIRAAIARASQTAAGTNQPPVDVFVTCSPLELARFPWEAWEIGSDFATTGTIRIIRSPVLIRREPKSYRRRRRPRILAILGDDTGLNFQVDREAVQRLSRMAEVQFVGWQPGQAAAAVKTQIQQAIAAEQGWDILLFAGHSNENPMTGGELAIAPGVSILIREIAPQLMEAQERGLQFALFNSCSGLNIAEALIDLGFNQVAIMREPIHNQVAQEFLVRFLQNLASHRDVHESLLSACQHLRLDKNLTYPSAYLVPSLFGHPGATWYRIPNWKEQLWHLVPTRLEALVLAGCVALSVLPAAQSLLLDRRIWVQAMYRDLTAQVDRVQTPAVTVVQIDRESLKQAGVAQINPLDRSYLARVIGQLTELGAPVIGVDYLLDVPQASSNPQVASGDRILGEMVERAVQQQGTWFVFSSVIDGNQEVGVNPATNIANSTWSLEGFTNADSHHLMLLYPKEDCRQMCPFAYGLVLAQLAQQDPQLATLPQQQWQRQDPTPLRTQVMDALDRQPIPEAKKFWQTLRFSPLTVWAYEQFYLHWLAPIVDYSIPPQQVYQRIPAWAIADAPSKVSAELPEQIIILAAGTYDQAGLVEGRGDNFPIPAAVRYWQQQAQKQPSLPSDADLFPLMPSSVLTGGEQLAYMVHHLLHQHRIIPIPDLWMVALGVLVGKGAAVWLKRQRQSPLLGVRDRYGLIKIGFISGTALYGLVSLQLYVSGFVLLPWMLPSIAFWIYLFPVLRSKNRG
ncbi:MAG: hypothetical protein Kow00121_44550 [Elainellaceae cyanobacterium]